jgi:hypothetical protein
MKYFLIGVTALFLLIAVGNILATSNDTAVVTASQLSDESAPTSRVYPIAPGVWYPGNGALPEKPVRYYRVRCWPGCHSGSSYGKYPDKPLNMRPIFPTQTIDNCPALQKETE